MKLRTELKNTRHNGIMAFGVGVEDTQHDLLAAHALLRAMDEFEANLSLGGIQWVRRRADELMRELTKQDEVTK